jgi:predicted nucleic acid-binding protein
MHVYFDASVLVAMFTHDPHSARADELLGLGPTAFVSDFAAAELASALGRLLRMTVLTAREARDARTAFDVWRHQESTAIASTTHDIGAAEAYLRRFDTKLRTPDAVNLAIAERCRLHVAVYDEDMAAAARALGIPLAPTSAPLSS